MTGFQAYRGPTFHVRHPPKKAFANSVPSLVDKYGLKDGESGPHVWLCGESRSLIAVRKARIEIALFLSK